MPSIHDNAAIRDAHNYDSSGEKLKSHGTEFHDQQLMLCLYESASKHDFPVVVTCEVKQAGAFDDIVLFYEHDDGRTGCRLIQVKHKQDGSKKIERKHLFGRTVYELKPYFDSYIEIMAEFESKYGCEIDELVICTNLDLSDSLKASMEVLADEVFEHRHFYRFKQSDMDLRESLIRKVYGQSSESIGHDQKCHIERFLNKLRFDVSRPDGDGLKNDIKREIVKCLHRYSPDISISSKHLDALYTSLFTSVFRFHTNFKVQVVTNEDCLTWLQEAVRSCEDRLSVYHDYNTSISRKYRLKFETRSLETLESFVWQHGDVPLNLVACAGTVLTVRRLVQVFERRREPFRLITGEQLSTSPMELKRDFEGCRYLVVELKSIERSRTILRMIEEILDTVPKKRIVLVSDVRIICDTLLFDVYDDHVAWDDLESSTREYIAEKEIIFQGQRVSFGTIDISRVYGSIDDETLSSLVLQDQYELGRQLTGEMSYFIERRVCPRNQITNVLENADADSLFAISDMDDVLFEQFMATVMSSHRGRFFRLNDETAYEEFEELVGAYTDRNIFWIVCEDRKFYWKRSSRSIVSIRRFLREDISRCIELETLASIEDRLVLIVGEPGMGKSSLLTALALRSIERTPEVWVVKIDLNSHTRYFFRMQRELKTFSDKESVVGFITSTQGFRNGFEKVLFESYFDIENRLVVLFDGFDEIAPHYRETVVGLVERLRDIGTVVVWLTSRPQERDYLADRLGVIAYSLQMFTRRDQRRFFCKFWNDSEAFVDRLMKIVSVSLSSTDRLPITGVPLQCRLIAEAYSDAFDNGTRLPDIIDILELYEHFIDKKCTINIVEKSGIDVSRPENIELFAEKKQRLIAKYKLLSLCTVFSETEREVLLTEDSVEKIDECILSIIEGIDKVGIVCSIENDKPVFVHRTFAEYFAALYCRDAVRDTTGAERSTLVRLLKDRLLRPGDEVFRSFFNRLAAGHDVFRYLLNGDMKQLQDLLIEHPEAIDSIDQFGRNLLHLSADYDYTDIARYLVESGADTTRRDDLFGMKPVEYACTLEIWQNVDSFLLRNEDDKSVLELIDNKKDILDTAIRAGYSRLARCLIEQGSTGVDDRCLHTAVFHGNMETCRYLIGSSGCVNVQDQFGSTPLHVACNRRRVDFVRYLLDSGADANVADRCEYTPLHFAVKNEDFDIIKMLTTHDPDIVKNSSFSETLLHVAVYSNRIDLVALLVGHGSDVHGRNVNEETPMHLARPNTSVEIVDFLLQRDAEIDAVDLQRKTPLMNYAAACNVAVVRHLLERGADPYRCSDEDRTALHYAVLSGHTGTVSAFITHDSNVVENVTSSETLLHEAVRSGREEIVGAMLDRGAVVDGRNRNGQTPLHVAENITVRIVDILLDRGADIEAVDSAGRTPIVYHVETGNIAVVRHLLLKGADVHRRCKYTNAVVPRPYVQGVSNDLVASTYTVEETLLHRAVRRCSIETIESLIEHRAETNGRNSIGQTPLHVVEFDTGVGVVDLLLNNGADIEATDDYGRTPLSSCVEVGNYAVVRHLLDRGADIHRSCSDGRTVLHFVAGCDSSTVAEMYAKHTDQSMGADLFDADLLYPLVVEFYMDFVKYLIGMGASVDAVDNKGETPLHTAVSNGAYDLVEYLIEAKGVPVDTLLRDGSSLLHVAASKYATNRHVFELLLRNGIDPGLKNAHGKTALDIIEESDGISAEKKRYCRQSIEDWTVPRRTCDVL